MLGRYLVYENIKTVPRWTLFKFLGVPFNATANAWKRDLAFVITGLLIALVAFPDKSIPTRLFFGFIYGLLMEVSYLVHDAGHIIGGKIVAAPMDEVLITSTRHVNIYRGSQDFPSQIHLSRALGGPLLNLLIGLVSLALWVMAGGHTFLAFALFNLLIGFGSFAPIRSVDGEVIWRELRRWKTD